MLRKWLVVPLLFLLKSATCQIPDTLLENVRNNFTVEKIYIHYDKPAYVAGETIWFKAYLAEGFLPSDKSTVLNLELVNDSGRTVSRKILPVIGSVVTGDFELDKDLTQGSYTVKAYTRRMMNFGTANFYLHTLNIYNPSRIPAENKKGVDAFIYFLPEGGNIIGNVANTIAFKCADGAGRPLSAEGKINDAAGKEVATFKSTHNGMGKFDFTPKPGEKYFAICNIENGQAKTVPLPDVLYEGITLRVKRSDGKAVFEVNRASVKNTELLPAYVLGVEENNIAFKAPLAVTGNIVTGEIPVKSLPAGILKVTVFNSQDKPLAERLLFINSEDYLIGGNFKTDTLSLSGRQKNVYSFELADTLTGTYSVAVTDAGSEIWPDEKRDNIISNLLLTNDLKGFIYNPGYYFEGTDPEHTANLDLVMLTSGWRRYSWNEILTGRFPSMGFKDIGYITLQGTAYDPPVNNPLKNGELSILTKTKDGSSNFFLLPTDAEGAFTIPGMIFEDSAKFTFQNNSSKSRKVNLSLKPSPLSNYFYVPMSITAPGNFFVPAANLNALISHSYEMKGTGLLLEEVRVNAKVKSKGETFEKKYVTGIIGNNARSTLDFLADPPHGDGLNILDYLKSKLPGVNISGGPANYFVNMRGLQNMNGPIPMNIFVDEMQVDPSQASILSVSQVAMVKVFSSGPMSGAGGALAIYRKQGGEDFIASGYTNINTVKVEGFSSVKEFFSPDYGGGNAEEIARDERSTLYWNPYLESNAQNKKITFSFYNSDKAKKIKVVLEGMTRDGSLLHLEKIIE